VNIPGLIIGPGVGAYLKPCRVQCLLPRRDLAQCRPLIDMR
jgi:hypothetical protein